MKKVISLFKRDYEGTRLVYDEVVKGAEWVQAGEGYATEKIDGTSCLIQDGKLFKRYDAKHGKTPPDGFVPAQEPDEVTGHWPGWLPVGDGNEDKWHREAWTLFNTMHTVNTQDNGTYELVGPKVQGNPYGYPQHHLVRHGNTIIKNVPTDFEGLKQCLADNPMYEGFVWHHPDGRMVKIKRKDFGFKWPAK